jgi:hypothetical protein
MDATAIIAAITAVIINGGALLSFWAWARAKISETAEIAAALDARLDTWRDEVNSRCVAHAGNIDKIFDKIAEVKDCVASKHTDTVRALTRLEEQVKALQHTRE